MYNFIIVTSCLVVNEYRKRRRRNKPKSKKTKN